MPAKIINYTDIQARMAKTNLTCTPTGSNRHEMGNTQFKSTKCTNHT